MVGVLLLAACQSSPGRSLVRPNGELVTARIDEVEAPSAGELENRFRDLPAG